MKTEVERTFAVPLARPSLLGNEAKYVNDCLTRNAISGGYGDYVEKFESVFASYVGARHAVACSNGTAALHLALVALGVKAGDRIIVPALTYVATANAVRYCGAEPVFVDVNERTWCAGLSNLRETIQSQVIIGAISVHLYGAASDMPSSDLVGSGFVVEDAAEALGTRVAGSHVGTFGNLGTFSFYGNKTITTGEGGMVVTSDDALASRLRIYRGQAQDPSRRYWHVDVGYNYRMPNVIAAIGLAQLERIDELVRQRQDVAALYRFFVSGYFEMQLQTREACCWMFSVLVPEGVNRDRVMKLMKEDGIETRPVFIPLPLQPAYFTSNKDITTEEWFPVAFDISDRGINLPTWAGMTEDNVLAVVNSLKRAVERAS